jgi:hypothetical protein
MIYAATILPVHYCDKCRLDTAISSQRRASVSRKSVTFVNLLRYDQVEQVI